jgi:cysteine-rich repeat protein
MSCGNIIRESGEECDDGNIVGGDGCSPSCQLEVGYRCTGSRLTDKGGVDEPYGNNEWAFHYLGCPKGILQ